MGLRSGRMIEVENMHMFQKSMNQISDSEYVSPEFEVVMATHTLREFAAPKVKHKVYPFHISH